MHQDMKKAVVFLLGLLILSPAIAWAASAMTGPFTQVDRIEKDLQRRLSTKSDVEKVLGKPHGFGTSILPTESVPHEVWFYQDIEITGMKAEPDGIIRAAQRQQILLLFFTGETYDGFLWYTTEGRVRGVVE
jgi:hypothetical protein